MSEAWRSGSSNPATCDDSGGPAPMTRCWRQYPPLQPHCRRWNSIRPVIGASSVTSKGVAREAHRHRPLRQGGRRPKGAESLKARGFDPSAVHVTQGSESVEAEVISPASRIESGPLTGLLHRLASLFGVAEPHVAHYEEAVRRGGSVVQVDASDEAQAATARDTLLAMGAVNIDDRVEEWQRAGWRSPAAGAERPERRRRPAARAASCTARRSASAACVSTVMSPWWRSMTSPTISVPITRRGTRCRARPTSDFDPAYRYGHALASDSRYDGRSWDEIEPEARAEWEQRHPQSAWERFKRAVRYAWEHAARR